uniref:NusG-like N-terminal domain-containing protein n=1 Tax=Kalanchoe fedtschenkoi TaxID=63787 RepID=A0A7N0UBD6_KALFE
MKPAIHLRTAPCRVFPITTLPVNRGNLRASRLVVAESAAAAVGSEEQYLTARERRQLRKERREEKVATNPSWREQVEDRLLMKPKKKYASWTEELNLDNLALLGKQWWVVRVSRVSGQDRAEGIARALVRTYPEMDFKVYVPCVHEKKKLKNGTIAVKPKPLFPGCVFLYCVLNKELHDYIRECDGVGGFVGSKVGSTKRQINRPKPVAEEDIESIFKQAKEEQAKSDQAFEAEQLAEGEGIRVPQRSIDTQIDLGALDATPKSKKKPKKSSESLDDSSPNKNNKKLLVPGSAIRVVSGTFSEFTGTLKKINKKTKKSTASLQL